MRISCRTTKAFPPRTCFVDCTSKQNPIAQGKLVRVVQGAVLDVCVDIRPNSPTYGQHFKVRLDAIEQGDALDTARIRTWLRRLGGWTRHSPTSVPPTTTHAAERTILWNDPDLAIDWGVADPIISAKDKEGIPFKALMERQAQR